MKKFNKKDYFYLLIIFTFLLMFVAFLYIKGYFFGSNVDWISQHFAIPEYFRTLFYDTKELLPNFAPHLGLGQNIFYFTYYGLLSPIILLSYILPFIPMHIYIQIISIIMILVSAFLIYRWILNKYNSNIAFFVTSLFILAGPLVYHSHRHIMFVIYMPFLIATLISVDNYFKNKNPIYIVLNIFLMILTSYYYSVGGIVVIGIYTIYKILETNKTLVISSFKPLFKVVYFTIIAILLSGIILIPTIYALYSGRADTNTAFNIIDLLKPTLEYKLTFYHSYSLGLTFIYVISLIAGLTTKEKHNIFLNITLLICMLFPITSYLLNGAMYVDGKAFIPFLPLAMLCIADFINKLSLNKYSFKKVMMLLIPFIILMIYWGTDNSNIYYLKYDIKIALGVVIYFLLKRKFNYIIFLIILIVPISSFFRINNGESYVEKGSVINIENSSYQYLLSGISDDSMYRTSILDNILKNVNRIYATNQYSSNIYSSSSNRYYLNFVRNTFQNEVLNKDNSTITQSPNALFMAYTGTKYILTKNPAPIGYEKIDNNNGVNLYKNEDVLPLAYATEKIMSLREFKTLEYPYSIDALLNYIIVDKSIENIYESNIKKYDYNYEFTDVQNLRYEKDNETYYIKADGKASLKAKLSNPIKDKVLIIKFKMNYIPGGNGCSNDISINGVKNSLSCSLWKYFNNNLTFEYVISSNEIIDYLNIELTGRKYKINQIELYTMDYQKIKDLKNNITEVQFDKNKSTNNKLVATINLEKESIIKTSIPYDKKGFKVYVDDNRVSKFKVDQTFLGFIVPAGTHDIRIEFYSPYLNVGIISSIIGVVLSLLLIFFKKFEKQIIYIYRTSLKYLKWSIKKGKHFLIKNKSYILLFISLFILDFSLRFFLGSSINYYSWYKIVPNLFSIIWILFILLITNILTKKFGKIFYLICYIVVFVHFLVHAIYFSYFNLFFDYSILSVANEGAQYFDTVLKNIKIWVLIIAIISITLTIKGFKKINFSSQMTINKLLIIIASFIICHTLLPLFLGNTNNSVEWDEWRNPSSIYKSFNDNNKSMMIAGLFEYNIRNFFVNFIRNNNKLTSGEEKALKENFDLTEVSNPNKYTGVFTGKNLIMIQLESIDDFLLKKNIMPTLYELSKNSLNFINHYSFTSGGGSTFNSEFMVNVGYSTAYNYNANAYLFSRNSYTYSLPNLFKNLNYRANAFHMNSAEYYSRAVNYKAFGYDNYYSLKDLGTYKFNEYWLDTELVKNEKFNNLIFNNETLSLSYIITYTAHMPYTTDRAQCQMLTTEKGLTELECLKIQAKETDDFLKLLLQNLAKNNMLDNTVLAIFTDHYGYTLEDKSILEKYKQTDNNLINKTPFIIWSNGLLKKNIKEVNSQLDILPTILNLFGVEYYPNNYIGRDILSNDFEKIVFFSDGSWYNGSTYVSDGEKQSGKKIALEKINYYNNYVKNKMDLNDAVLKSDYFGTQIKKANTQ